MNAVHKLREAPKSQSNRMEAIIATVEDVAQWRLPPFQRPLRVNARVHEIAEQLGTGGCIEGVITLGRLLPDKTLYIVDGQHRIEAFRLSGLKEVYIDTRVIEFEDMAAMAIEFERLNTPIARMIPDDTLRALEFSVPALAEIRQACPFVGYGNLRRNASPGGPIVGMSVILRVWWGSGKDTPVSNGAAAAVIAREMSPAETKQLISFLSAGLNAWGRDAEYWRLWGSLNLGITMWLYRRLVLDQARSLKRAAVLSPAQFQHCLMALSTDNTYLDWLVGRQIGDRDRSPCYTRVTSIFVKRLMETAPRGDKGRPKMPQPAWSSHSKG